jgi:hypothetical protein
MKRPFVVDEACTVNRETVEWFPFISYWEPVVRAFLEERVARDSRAHVNQLKEWRHRAQLFPQIF